MEGSVTLRATARCVGAGDAGAGGTDAPAVVDDASSSTAEPCITICAKKAAALVVRPPLEDAIPLPPPACNEPGCVAARTSRPVVEHPVTRVVWMAPTVSARESGDGAYRPEARGFGVATPTDFSDVFAPAGSHVAARGPCAGYPERSPVPSMPFRLRLRQPMRSGCAKILRQKFREHWHSLKICCHGCHA